MYFRFSKRQELNLPFMIYKVLYFKWLLSPRDDGDCLCKTEVIALLKLYWLKSDRYTPIKDTDVNTKTF